MTKRVLAIDPGETTGWAYIEPDRILDIGQFKFRDVNEFLGEWPFDIKPIDFIVIEDFKIFDKKKVRMGDRMITTRIIGACELFAKMLKIKVVKQDSSVLPAAIRRTGIDPYKGSHSNTHWAFAYVHGMYFFIQMGLAKSALQKSKEIK